MNNTNQNDNENLTPEELIEKLKEKLAIDRDTYSKIVENNTLSEDSVEQTNEQLDEIIDNDVEMIEEIEEADEVEEVEIIEEIEEIDDSNASENNLGDAFFEVADDVEYATLSDNDEQTEIFAEEIVTNTEESDSNEEYVDSRIRQMLEEISDEEDDDVKTAGISNGSIKDQIQDLGATTVFGSVSADDYSDNTDSVIKDNIAQEKAVKRPTVYRFRRVSDDNEQTKLHDAVASDFEEENELEQTKLNDVPELKKPDLVVMQTFGATVEHVRALYGDDMAEEYEKILANSDFTEREAAEYEYTSPAQKNEIFYEFKNKMLKSKWKILLCGVLCALMLLLENIGMLGVKLGGMLDSSAFPVSYIMIDLQLLLICAVLAYPILKSGFSDIIALEPTSKSITVAIVSVAVVVDIISCFVGGSIILYNFAAGMALLFSMIYDVVILKRDYMAFKVLSSDKVKNAAVLCVGTSSTPEVAVYEKLDDDEEVKIVGMQRAKFVKSFFARTKQTDSSFQDKIILPLTFAAMIVIFVISMVMGSGVADSLRVANMSFSVFLPFAVYFSLSFPMSKASVSVYENGAAIIGNAALEEYSGSSIVSFEDRDVFPSYCVKLKSVKVYGNSRIDRVLYNASSVFSKLGGPLSDVFSLSTMEIGCSENVEILCVEDEGIEALVDGKKVLVGRPSFLSNYGIFVRKDESDTDDYAMLYIAEGDILSAKFYIKYSLDVDFENVMSRLTSCGICAVLKTFDPNIDSKMLSKFIDTSKYPVRVVKCKLGEDLGNIYEEIDSGIISTTGAKNTVDATVACERLYNIRTSSNNVKIVSMVIGMILSLFVAFFGVTPFSSLIVVFYQLIWTIPAIVSGKMYL